MNLINFKTVVENPQMYGIPADMAVLHETLNIPERSLTTPTTHVDSWPMSIANFDKTAYVYIQ